MRRSLTRAIAVVVVLAVGWVVPVGTAFAATAVKTAKNVTALEESWYYQYRQPLEPVPQAPGETGDPLPTQQDNVKAQVRQRSNPYEPETLHVGVNAGEPEARTFLYWDPFSLSDEGLATIVGGTVTLPLVETRGVRNAENALMLACMNKELPTSDLGGEWKEQPKYDCETSAEVKLVKDSDPLTWTVDLDAFGPTWRKNPTEYAGIAIVEHPKSAESPQSSTWHVAFAGQFNETEGAKKVTADLKYEVEEFDLPEFDPLPPVESFEDAGAAGGGDFGGDFGGDAGFGADDSFAAPGGGGASFSSDTGVAMGTIQPPVDTSGLPAPAAPQAQAPQAVAAPAAPPAQVAQPVSAPGPIRNPFGYWLLPIVGLLLAGVFAWSLTRPVELVHVREGAVSRLMRARAGRA